MSRPACGRQLPKGGGPCQYPRMKGKQRCRWHWLMAQSSDVQAQAAADRREDQLGHDFVEYVKRVPAEEWPPGERWCAGCQSFVPFFYVSGSRCKACSSSAAHERRLETTYGITAERYREIWLRQGQRCAICRNRSRTIRFAVDHDHKTDEVRGILCKRCNHDLLGGGHDSVDMLWRAITYLLFPPARGVEPRPEQVIAALQERLAVVRLLAQPKAPERQEPPF